MQAEVTIEVDRRIHTGAARRAWHRDVGAQFEVLAVAERDDDVERVGGAALEETDEHLPLRSARKLESERGAAQERGGEAHRDQGEGAGADEDATMHGRYLLWNSGLPIARPTIWARPCSGGIGRSPSVASPVCKGLRPSIRISRVSGETRPPRNAAITPST